MNRTVFFMDNLHKTLKKDIKDLKKLDSQTKVYLIIFMILVFVAALLTGASMISSRPQTSFDQSALPAPTEEPTTTLSLSPSSQALKVGEVTNVSVILSKTPVQSADIVLTWDPKVFNLYNIRNGTILPNVLNQNLTAGKLTFSASVDPTAKNASTGEMFAFSLKALSPSTSSPVEFDKKLTITSSDGKNILGLTVGGNYSVSQ